MHKRTLALVWGTEIVRTDDKFDILVDLTTGSISGTDVSMWENGSSDIFAGFKDYFLHHDWILADQQRWAKAFNSAQREDIKEGLFMASQAYGSKNALNIMTDIGINGALLLSLGTGGLIFKGGIKFTSSILKFSGKLGRGTTAFSVSRNLVEGDYLEAGLELTIFGTYRIANNAVLNSATHSFADKLGVSRLLYATESITTLFSDY